MTILLGASQIAVWVTGREGGETAPPGNDGRVSAFPHVHQRRPSDSRAIVTAGDLGSCLSCEGLHFGVSVFTGKREKQRHLLALGGANPVTSSVGEVPTGCSSDRPAARPASAECAAPGLPRALVTMSILQCYGCLFGSCVIVWQVSCARSQAIKRPCHKRGLAVGQHTPATWRPPVRRAAGNCGHHRGASRAPRRDGKAVFSVSRSPW